MTLHVWIVVVDQDSKQGKLDGRSAYGPFMNDDRALEFAGEVSSKAMDGEFEINSVIAMPCYQSKSAFFAQLRSET